ncbi:MAG: nuclear transport factor 2 family protein [Actinomycetota bacterium]
MAAVADHVDASPNDIDAIEAAALDYLEGYVAGDAERHARSYHPEAVKRRYTQDEAGVFGIINLSPTTMADFAALTEPEDDCEIEIFIDDVSQDIASVRVYSCHWVDFLHVVKARGEWKLFHVTWHSRSTT